VDESTDRSMETSSDEGSTVRELNRQLETTGEKDDDGNGTVSHSGSAHHGLSGNTRGVEIRGHTVLQTLVVSQ